MTPSRTIRGGGFDNLGDFIYTGPHHLTIKNRAVGFRTSRPVGTVDCILPGGSWLSTNSRYLRRGEHDSFLPSNRYYDLGFRCARPVQS